MPWTKRTHIKRKIAQAFFSLDKSMKLFLVLKRVFEEHHPQEAEELENAAAMLLLVQTFLVEFARKHYALEPESYESYL